jgi:trans-AT polyketide synthase/acyltransferase/oxidoreductase domain-containing protein
MKAFMFPGQGAQRIGMGAGLFEEFADLTRTADAVLGYSIQALCLEGPIERLTLTQFTQPAIYVVNALSYLKRIQDAPKPDYLLGHSVAEYVALFAAGVLDFESGLRLVQKRGELMGQAKGGGMAAVIGLNAAQVAAILERNGIVNVFAANFNTPHQIVISGRRDDVEKAEPLFLAGGAGLFKMLQVGGAFHTPFMADAQQEFRHFVSGIPFAAPQVPVISNVTARPHRADSVRRNMVDQITAPVRWSDSIRYLLAKGLVFKDFDEIGTQGVSIVKTMVMRTNAEAGPLDAALLEAEERAEQEQLAKKASPAEPPAEASIQAPIQAPAAPVAAVPASPAPAISPTSASGYGAASLGSKAFCEDFNLKYAYMAGGMYQGIASTDVVVRLAKSGFLGFFGAGGIKLPEVEQAIKTIQARLPGGEPWGINFIASTSAPEREESLVDLLLRLGVRTIEASAFMEVTPSLVRYRAKGLARGAGGRVRSQNKIVAKISRPDVGLQFLSPAPERIVAKLIASGAITSDEADMLRSVPIADALCVEADSGGHTDQGMPFTLIPAVLRVRDECEQRFPSFGRIHVGAAGGIGTPEAAAAAFVMGVDFILTGSINQCTVEAGTSDVVKDLLQEMNVYDTDYAPSGDLFELGAKVQVLKKGIFFPARANKLIALYRQHESIDEVDQKTRQQIQERYFKRSFDDVFDEVRRKYPGEMERAARSPKHKMALIFKRYFSDSTRWALTGDIEHKVDFQIQCGPALGAFNQWVAGTELNSWRARHVDLLAERLMAETAALLRRRFAVMQAPAGRN